MVLAILATTVGDIKLPMARPALVITNPTLYTANANTSITICLTLAPTTQMVGDNSHTMV